MQDWRVLECVNVCVASLMHLHLVGGLGGALFKVVDLVHGRRVRLNSLSIAVLDKRWFLNQLTQLLVGILELSSVH